MNTVFLICTAHAEVGKVNAYELHQLLERINPDVAFLEVPATWGYLQIINHTGLESIALSSYREAHSVTLVPVDLPTPPASFFENSKYLFNYIERVSDKYCRLMDENKINMTTEGFPYLNSDLHDHIQLEIHGEILRILEMRGDLSLTNAYEAWRRQDDLREREMISNIEKCGRERKFDRAVLLVGAAHRSSIVRKSSERFSAGIVDVHWDYSSCFCERLRDGDASWDGAT